MQAFSCDCFKWFYLILVLCCSRAPKKNVLSSMLELYWIKYLQWVWECEQKWNIFIRGLVSSTILVHKGHDQCFVFGKFLLPLGNKKECSSTHAKHSCEKSASKSLDFEKVFYLHLYIYITNLVPSLILLQ